MNLADILRQFVGIVPDSSHGTPGRIMLMMILTAVLGSAGLMLLDARLSEPAGADAPVVLMAKGEEGVTVSQVTDDDFVVNSTALDDTGKSNVARRAKTIPADSDVVIIGYADDRGSTALNEALADGRARSVRDALNITGRPPRIVSAGKRTADPSCGSRPAAEREACFRHDRRVEIWSRPAPAA